MCRIPEYILLRGIVSYEHLRACFLAYASDASCSDTGKSMGVVDVGSIRVDFAFTE
jgi:hypothetical protein